MQSFLLSYICVFGSYFTAAPQFVQHLYFASYKHRMQEKKFKSTKGQNTINLSLNLS